MRDRSELIHGAFKLAVVLLARQGHYGTHVVKEELVVTRHLGLAVVGGCDEVCLEKCGGFFLQGDKMIRGSHEHQ